MSDLANKKNDSDRKILLVDDDAISNLVSKHTIEKADIQGEIKDFLQAKEALKYIRMEVEAGNQLPDLIFLDLNMPVMNGWDFLEEFRKIDDGLKTKTKIIILTSSVYLEDKRKAESYPEVTDYAIKPLDVVVVRELKEKYLV